MKKRIVFIMFYVVFVLCAFLTAGSIAKYISTESGDLGFQIGSTLYFNYDRHELYRNDQLIVGVETEYEENGQIFKRIETMNVVPGDNLTYHFFVSNFDTKTGETNNIAGEFFPNAKTTLALPVKGSVYDVNCTITYRRVAYGSEDTGTYSDVWNNLVSGSYLDLPVTSTEKVKYEFKVSVLIDDQVENTTSEDYFDATLTIKLFINAASK